MSTEALEFQRQMCEKRGHWHVEGRCVWCGTEVKRCSICGFALIRASRFEHLPPLTDADCAACQFHGRVTPDGDER